MSENTEDHRLRRWKLGPEAFVEAPDPEPVPTDMIDKQTWTDLTWLADDVSLRTTEHHGSTFKAANELWGHWLTLTLDIQGLLDDPREDALALGCLAITDELQASSYAALTGFYRQAIAGLRPALEAILTGAHFRAFPDPEEFTKWADGLREGRLWWGKLRKQLTTIQPYARFGAAEEFLSDDGLVAFLYGRLSAFTHSRPFFTDEDGRRIPTTNVELWDGSNGPVYVSRSVQMWSVYHFSVILTCVLLSGLADPRLLKLPRSQGVSYLAYLERTLSLQPAIHPSVRPVVEYLRQEASKPQGA